MDTDVLIEPTKTNAIRAWNALSRFGAPLHGLTLRDLESPNLIHQFGVEPNRVDILTRIEGVRFASGWSRRPRATYGGVPISILSINDLVRAKRAAGGPQDLIDIGNLRLAGKLAASKKKRREKRKK